MKMLRRIQLSLLVFATPAMVQAQFVLATNGNSITIVQYTGNGGPVTIPAMTNGYPVKSIAGYAFYEALETTVSIPSTITNIGEYAFYGSGLSGTLKIPGSVIDIGQDAFFECYQLTSVVVSNGVTTIGSLAFANDSAVTNLTLPNSITSIGSYALSTGPSLTSITLPTNLTTLADGLLGGDGFTSISIPSAVTNIGQYVFQSCQSISKITIPNAVISIGDYAFSSCYYLTNIALGTNVTSLGIYEFYGDFSLPGVILPNSLTSIGDDAFESDFALTNITIPRSVTQIGLSPFNQCSSLTAINVDPANPNYSSVGGVLFDKAGTTLLMFPEGITNSYVIPDGVTNIATEAFYYYDCPYGSQNTITIPASVTTIGSLAFYNCNIPGGVFFAGNPPSTDGTDFLSAITTIYYLPGATGWSNPYEGVKTVLWNPLFSTNSRVFGVHNNQFKVAFGGTLQIPFVLEAATNLAHPVWKGLVTNVLTVGSYTYADPQYTNSPARFYRIVPP